MSESERQEIITILILWTTWSEEALNNMSNRRLLETYDRYLKMR